MAPYTQTVTLVRRTKGPLDALGNDTWIEGASPVPAVLALTSSNEQLQGRDSVTITGSIYVAAGTDVRAVDVVVIDGARYEVDGAPITWEHPLTGWKPGIEVRVKRVTG